MNKNYKKNIYVPEDVYQKLNQIKSITHKPYWAIIDDFMNYWESNKSNKEA